MAIATMTGSCPGVEQSSIQGGKLPSSSRSIKSGAMHLAPAPDIKELSNFLLLERSSIQVWKFLHFLAVVDDDDICGNCDAVILNRRGLSSVVRRKLGCGFPVSFEFPPLPGKPSSVCLATEFA